MKFIVDERPKSYEDCILTKICVSYEKEYRSSANKGMYILHMKSFNCDHNCKSCKIIKVLGEEQ